jgi:hypothetical protein
MGQRHEQEHHRLGRAAKLKGASFTVDSAAGARQGTWRVSIDSVVPRGSSPVGFCTVHMHGPKAKDHGGDVRGTFEYDPMSGLLEILAIGSGFKYSFVLGNFNLTSQAGNGQWAEKHVDAGDREFSQGQGLNWRVNHWGRDHARDGHCDKVEIPIF